MYKKEAQFCTIKICWNRKTNLFRHQFASRTGFVKESGESIQRK